MNCFRTGATRRPASGLWLMGGAPGFASGWSVGGVHCPWGGVCRVALAAPRGGARSRGSGQMSGRPGSGALTVDDQPGSRGRTRRAAQAGILASRDIASRDIASRDIASRDIASRDIASRDIAICKVTMLSCRHRRQPSATVPAGLRLGRLQRGWVTMPAVTSGTGLVAGDVLTAAGGVPTVCVGGSSRSCRPCPVHRS